MAVKAGDTLGWINFCVPMTDCDAQTVYDGFLHPTTNTYKLDSFFSCHKCTDGSKVPVAFVSGGTTTSYAAIRGLRPYSATNSGASLALTLTDVSGSAVSGSGGRSVLCMTPASIFTSPAAEAGPTLGFTGSPVENCAMIFVNVDGGKDATESKSTSATPDLAK